MHVSLTGWARPVYRGELSEELIEELTCNRVAAWTACRPYLFAELERKVSREEGGRDRRDLARDRRPRHAHARAVVDALAAAARDPGTHQYPSNRGRPELREAFARFYERRFGVALDPETEIIPALGAKECVFNLNLAFLDPDTIALAADPGYPVYTGGPLLAGARGGADAAGARARLRARPRRDRRRRGAAARGCSTSTTRTTRPAPSCPTACSSARSSSRASTTC